MILAIDVYYIDDKAKSVGILFDTWLSETPEAIVTDYLEHIAPYQSGAFYLRELPCIISLLKKIDLSTISVIVIDGYVYLNDGKIGLGGHLYHELKQSIPVIGVAKKSFLGNENTLKEVFRGKSLNPLYITAIGLEAELAAKHIQSMAGKHRMPSLLTFLDQQTKLFKSEMALLKK